MLTEIRKLIAEGKYLDAMLVIKQNLDRQFNLKDKNSEKEYTELLKLRITCHTLSGSDDAIVLDMVRKEKYPSEMSYQVDGKLKINLLFKNHFDFKCYAYVNTVNITSPFYNVTDNSATSEFVKRMTYEKILIQMKTQKKKSPGDFLLLEHPELSAPLSYHILFYQENEKPDYTFLEKGIRQVLADAIKKEIKTICFFPLGYALVAGAVGDERQRIAEEMANKIAEIIVSFYYDNREKIFPVMYFNFVTVLTMITFDRAFNRWTKYDKIQINQIKRMPEKQRRFVQSIKTKDVDFIQSLERIFYLLNERKSILLLGETGVGKSHLAGKIYESSEVPNKRMVKVNCAMLKPNTIYPQLFGWKKGSFTDAKYDGPGAIGTAEGGVLFLDEIGYADIDVQRMLLKFLDDGEYSRLGEEEVVRRANVKFIFGTNVDLEEKISQKLFAHDLYERISKFTITIPPLRKRKCDIPLLIDNFIDKLNEVNERNIIISEQSKESLTEFDWPGNVRQLQSHIEYLYILAKQNNLTILELGLVKKHQPRKTFLIANDPVQQLEMTLLKILKSWNPENGKLLDDFIQPILAKLYVEDLKLKKDDSMKILGLDGTRGKESTLTKRLNLYPSVRKTFDK